MWIFLWIVASTFILGVFGWSLVILLQQKRAWSAFAKKHNLMYVPGKIIQAPAMKGVVYGHQVAFFPDIQATQDQRGQRFVTVLEFDVGQGMPTGALIATPNFAVFASNLNFTQKLDVDFPGWDKSRIILTRDSAALKQYLTNDRLELLHGIMSMKNATALYFFDEESAIVHIETSDPIRDEQRMERIVQKITSSLPRLKLMNEERAQLKKI
ncbi:MAG: hypothetical protein HYS17_04705 [Micavibrio aeruginosavorus]|uniref:DUF3137 domain-containing protein n=1 Tax=Micavibrio aeruginosavorus TaxID=349221 RepID=A0A7T5UH97_9BACT|nr:MAG: hypothetical protein HYS17_04705 [Micavibrio aeruginosavorus]